MFMTTVTGTKFQTWFSFLFKEVRSFCYAQPSAPVGEEGLITPNFFWISYQGTESDLLRLLVYVYVYTHISRAETVPWCTSQPNGAQRRRKGLRAGSYPHLTFHPGSTQAGGRIVLAYGCVNDLFGISHPGGSWSTWLNSILRMSSVASYKDMADHPFSTGPSQLPLEKWKYEKNCVTASNVFHAWCVKSLKFLCHFMKTKLQ